MMGPSKVLKAEQGLASEPFVKKDSCAHPGANSRSQVSGVSPR